MSLSLITGCIWAILATFVAFLPMRRQFPPGIVLLIAAPLVLGWIAWDHGAWIFAAGLIGFLSMFRNPLIYFFRRARGQKPEVPS